MNTLTRLSKKSVAVPAPEAVTSARADLQPTGAPAFRDPPRVCGGQRRDVPEDGPTIDVTPEVAIRHRLAGHGVDGEADRLDVVVGERAVPSRTALLAPWRQGLRADALH